MKNLLFDGIHSLSNVFWLKTEQRRIAEPHFHHVGLERYRIFEAKLNFKQIRIEDYFPSNQNKWKLIWRKKNTSFPNLKFNQNFIENNDISDDIRFWKLDWASRYWNLKTIIQASFFGLLLECYNIFPKKWKFIHFLVGLIYSKV